MKKSWLHPTEHRCSQSWVQKGHKCLLISFSWLQSTECPAEYNPTLLCPSLRCHCSKQFSFPHPFLFCEQMLHFESGENTTLRGIWFSGSRRQHLCVSRGGDHKWPCSFSSSCSLCSQVPTAPYQQVAGTAPFPVLSAPPQPGGADSCRRPT